VLDTVRTYETPEGILLELRVAGPVVRACAWAIDALIRLALYLGLVMLFSFLGGLGMGIMLIGFFLIEWFYPAIFEAHYGATPGKKAMRIQVIQDDGTALTWVSSMIRNLVRAADFFPLLYGFGLLAMLSNRDFKRLGDLAAGTLVVYRTQQRDRVEAPSAESPKPLPVGMSVEEQRVLLDFAERRDRLSPQRQEELAELVPLLTTRRGPAAVDELLAYASWLARGR
jgi:uncharacterized RDD family membrane protein YckC